MQHHTNSNSNKKQKKKHPIIPEDLIREILLKLKVKPLVRFTSVSKSWRSLISNPLFSKSHFDLTPHPIRLLHVDFHFNFTRAHSIDLDASLHNDAAHHVINFPLQTFSHTFPIRGSCRGIVLLDGYNKLFLWNPSTASLKRLSYPPLASTASFVSFGFGYDESTDDYLVAVAWNHFPATEPACYFHFFSARSNSWSKIECDDFYSLRAGDQSGWFLHGCVHWLAQDAGKVHVIVALDLARRRISEISPPPREFFFWNFCRLRVLGGCLSVVFSNEHEEVEIWVMREYRVGSSWTRHVVVADYQSTWHHLSPICFNSAGEVIAKDDRVGLVKLDGRGELVEIRAYCSKSTTALYMETLLSPP